MAPSSQAIRHNFSNLGGNYSCIVPAAHQCGELISGKWPAEQIALNLLAAFPTQEIGLLYGFDPLGGGDHFEALA